MTQICNFRWEAPRVEVESVPVTHVCALNLHHEGLHACSCGRISLMRRVDTEVSQQPKYNSAGALITACEVTWEAKRWCSAWGVKGPHGCKYKPGHEGVHRCPCGSKHE